MEERERGRERDLGRGKKKNTFTQTNIEKNLQKKIVINIEN